MKKLIAIFLCIIMISGIGVAIFQKTRPGPFEIENILPQNVSFYVQLHDVEKNFKELESMPIWRGLSQIDYDALIKNDAIGGRQAMFLNLIKNQLSDVMNNPLAERLLGHDVAIAVYPLDKDIASIAQEMKVLNPQFIEELLSGLFFVTRVGSDVQFIEFVSRFFNQFGSNISQGQVEYKREIIRTIIISDIGMKFGIVRLNDLLVIGIGEKAARMSIDVYKRDEPSLAKDPQFAKTQDQFLKPSSMVGYFNFAKLLKEIKKQGDKLIFFGEETAGDVDLQIQWEKILAKISGLKAFAFSSQLKPIIRIDSRLIFDPKDFDSLYTSLYTCPSSENKTIHFTPQEVLGYHWNNCLKLDYYWEQIVKELKQGGASTSRIDEFEAAMGLSVKKDILPAFGEEIGGYIEDVQVGGLFPIPKILAFVEVKSKSKVEALLKRLEEQPFVMLQDEEYNGTLIRYIALPLGQDVQPGYAFLEDYLLISTSRTLIQESIDAFQDTSLSLQFSPDFKAIDFGLSDKSRSVQFFKVGQVIEKVKGIIEWSSQWMGEKDYKTEAFKTGSTKLLEEVKLSIALKESELEAIRERLILLEDEIWNLESKGSDGSIKQAELNELQNQLDAKKEEIIIEKERKEELASIVGKPDQKSLDSETRQFYLDKAVYPILNSLKSIQSFGLRSTVDGDALESSLFLKIND